MRVFLFVWLEWPVRSRKTIPKVLIVDDEKTVVNVVKKFLREDGYVFLEAHDGKEAVERARNEMPSLIVLDLLLPGMNGYEVVEQLRGDERTVKIPVVILSAASVDEERLRGRGDGLEVMVMEKPIQREKLQHTVKEILMGER